LQKLWYYIPALLWAILIFSLSTTAGIQLPNYNFLAVDKLGHITFYAILLILMVWGISKQKQWDTIQWIGFVAAMSIAFAYGASLEWVQSMLPHRCFDTADMLANGIGIVLASILLIGTKKYWLSSQ